MKVDFAEGRKPEYMEKISHVSMLFNQKKFGIQTLIGLNLSLSLSLFIYLT